LFRGEIGPSYSYVEIFISGFIQTKTKNKVWNVHYIVHYLTKMMGFQSSFSLILLICGKSRIYLF
jgi:hypothetical protein